MSNHANLDDHQKDSNYFVLNSVDFELRPGGTVKFEGAAYGFDNSFFYVKNKPGEGPPLHIHPYPETWFVLKGNVRFTVGGEVIEAAAGKIVVAGKEIPHKFVNVGADVLEMMCIHPAPRIIQVDLE